MSSQDEAVLCEHCGNPYIIHELQLKINRHDDIIVEWIHYNRFNDIKEINKDDIATLYSATWMDGQLKYKNNKKEKVKSYYSIYRFDYYILKIYGISQNPETRDYIIVFQEVYCETCSKICTDLRRCWRSPCKINNLKQNFTNWTSGNEKIDEFIQEMQLKINRYDDKVTPLLGNRSYFHLFVSYSKYLNGPSIHIAEYNVAVSSLLISLILLNRLYGIHSTILRCVNGSQKFIDEAKGYSIDDHEYDVPHIYGITQNADTKDYIIVLDDRYCKNCGKIGEIYTNEGFQCNIKMICKDDFTTLYSAIWVEGPLNFGTYECKWDESNKKVILKCLYQNITDEFLNRVLLIS
ncbi:kinase-like domain-containing protein [Rhizophagus clarus]|uniref:Kinase-like domain-containing protein n=1 Tax=Rhizophagus clarus TaxID=94130 RepID=A0A8H3L9H7_9GLOM|nr:kinase-like domain-containing protein [Rhizophagus clarus]